MVSLKFPLPHKKLLVIKSQVITQTITVTKILPPEAPLAIAHLEEGTTPAVSDDVLKGVGDESGPSTSFEHSAGDRVRKSSESLESLEAKRSKSG